MYKSLTLQQEKFIQELIKGKSQRKAYQLAYPRSRSWKHETVDEAACRLFKNNKVNTRYQEIRNRLVKEIEEEAIITAKEIINEIVSIAKDDIGNYLEYRTEKVIANYDKDGKPIYSYRMVIDMKDSENINTKNISEIILSNEGQLKFKMYSRATALYKLADMFGINKTLEAKQELAEKRFEEDKNIHGKKYW